MNQDTFSTKLVRNSIIATFLLVILPPLLLSCIVHRTEWGVQLPGRRSDLTSVRVDRQHFYVAVRGVGVFAISRENGKILWRFPSAPNTTPVTALDGEALYIAEGNAVSLLDIQDGHSLWQIDLREPISADASVLTLPNSFLIVSSASGSLYRIEKSGEVRWTFTIPVSKGQTIMPLFTSTERVALAVGKLSYEDYYYLLDGQMYIISADSGKLLWNTDLVDLTGHNDIPLPAVNESEDHIYLAVDGMVGAFEGNTGKIIWQHAHLLATNNLILQENDLIISGPIFIGMMDRISGKLHCKQIGTELGKFIGMDNRGLYYVKYHMEPQKFLWWELHKWTYKSDLYIVEQSTCRLHLQATLNDNLVAYDPATGEGLVVVGDLDNPIILRQTMVPLP